MERTWRDVRKDALEPFRKIFDYLDREAGLLDMSNDIQRLCLYVVFQPRIQAALNRAADAWNHHRIRTAQHRTPIAIFELSRQHAITRGYWTGDPGDDIHIANLSGYGLEEGNQHVEPEDSDNIRVNDDEDIEYVRRAFSGMGVDLQKEDGNWGIEVYCEAVLKFKAFVDARH